MILHRYFQHVDLPFILFIYGVSFVLMSTFLLLYGSGLLVESPRCPVVIDRYILIFLMFFVCVSA